MTEVAERRAELLRELQDLEAAEHHAEMMRTFRESLSQISDVLKDQKTDVEAATQKIDEAKESLDEFRKVVEQAKELIESKALDGLDEGAQRSGKAYDTIKDGVGQFGEKSGEAAEAIADLEAKLSKVDELQNMGGDQAGDLIRE
ncbi:MAG: hypothetical protein AAGE98_15890, partial [Actinomycetota bacterium]